MDLGSASSKAGRLLIYAPVPLFRFDGALYVERQAINGLRLWASHFAEVITMMPVQDAPPPVGWLAADEHLAELDRVRLEPLPMAYRPDQFMRVYRETRAKIGQLIGQAEYLSFAIGGLFGDWGAVSAFEARKQGRRFAVWTDRVESEVVRQDLKDPSRRKRWRARLTYRPMVKLEHKVVSMASLGLFHGKDTFDAYSPHSCNAHLVHDIHIRAEDHIAPDQLTAKLADAQQGPLRIVYAGRADAMKGPLDWIAVLERLSVMGVDFCATWLGDGEELEQMRKRIQRAGLSERVFLPGFVSDHAHVLDELRRAHLFMFCHKTPESPRCLIEALSNAAPIVGYDSSYAQDLISAHGGGALVPIHDVEQLAARVADLAHDRTGLAQLVSQARLDGEPFTDSNVFEHRSHLIKEHLRPDTPGENRLRARWGEKQAL